MPQTSRFGLKSALFAALSLAAAACGESSTNTGSGGAASGGTAHGGATSQGGSIANGGDAAVKGGGSSGGAGNAASGGADSAGGSDASGGTTPTSGGTSATSGGAATTGGKATSGGAPTSGGAGASAGKGGMATSGGVAGSGNDPAPGAYGKRADLLEPNSEMAVAEVGGKIYVLGGYPSSRQVQATVEVYDPATDRWELAPELPIAIHHPVALGVGGKLYSFGGQLASSSGTAGETNTNRTLIFDPAVPASGWVDGKAMITARGAGAGAVIGDKVYVAGGRPPAGNAFEVYDVSDDAWTALPDLPQAFPERNHIAAAVLGGKVYVAGGRYGGGSFSSPMTDSLDVFDPVANTWSAAAPMLRPRGGVNGVAAFGCFFVWGGEGSNTGEPNDVFPDHDVYDPRTNRWTALSELPTPVHGVTGAAFLDGLIYIPGGGTMQGGSSGSRIFQVYRPTQRCE